MADDTIVTYLGPTNPHDPSTVYLVPGEAGKPDVELVRGITNREVPSDVASQLSETAGHRFKIGAELEAEDLPPWSEYDLMDEAAVLAAIDNPMQVATATMADRVAAYEAAHENRTAIVDAAEHQAEAYRAGEPTEFDDGLDDLVKADLHRLLDDNAIEYLDRDKNDELVDKLREAGVTAESLPASDQTG